MYGIRLLTYILTRLLFKSLFQSFKNKNIE